jgi:hypothetical protein
MIAVGLGKFFTQFLIKFICSVTSTKKLPGGPNDNELRGDQRHDHE